MKRIISPIALVCGFSMAMVAVPSMASNWMPPLTYQMNLAPGSATNSLPLTVADSATVTEDGELANVNVLANDSDADNHPLRVYKVEAGNGEVTINSDSTLNYSPSLNFAGSDVITYYVTDGLGARVSGQLTVTVTGENDQPIALDDIFAVRADIPQSTLTVLANDTDVDSTNLSVINASAEFGEVTINVDNTLQFVPVEGFQGTDTIFYTISDGEFTASATATVNVVPVNDVKPVITGQQTIEYVEDTYFYIALEDLLVVDADSTDFTLTVQDGDNYNLREDGEVIPTWHYHGELNIPVTVSDGLHTSDPFVVSVTLTPVNDPPQNPGSILWKVSEGSSRKLNYAAMFYDPDLTLDPESVNDFTFEFSDQNWNPLVNGKTLYGRLTPVPHKDNGWFYYTPDPGINDHQETIFMDVTDDHGVKLFRAATVIYKVEPATGYPPLITGQSLLTTAEETPITLSASDFSIEDQDSASFTLSVTADGPKNYSFEGTTITPAKDFVGTLSVLVTVSDGVNASAIYEAQVEVTNINDAPTVFTYETQIEKGGQSGSIHFRTGMTYDVDVKTDSARIDLFTYQFIDVNNSTNGITPNGEIKQIDGQAPGVFRYTPNPDFTGRDEIAFWVTDDEGLQSQQSYIAFNVYDPATPPLPPTDLAVEQLTDKKLEISWQDPNSGLPKDFYVYQSINGKSFSALTKTSEQRFGYSVATGGNYRFKIKACYKSELGGICAPETNLVEITIDCGVARCLPQAMADTVRVRGGSKEMINVLNNDLVNGSDIRIQSIVTPSELGQVSTVSYYQLVEFDSTAVSCADGLDKTTTFDYTARNASGDVSFPATATVTIDCTPDDFPSALDDHSFFTLNNSVNVDVLSNDSDPANLALNVSQVVVQPSVGTADLVNGKVQYTPANNYCGPDSFTYEVRNTNGIPDYAVVSLQCDQNLSWERQNAEIGVPITLVNAAQSRIAKCTSSSAQGIVEASIVGGVARIYIDQPSSANDWSCTDESGNWVVDFTAPLSIEWRDLQWSQTSARIAENVALSGSLTIDVTLCESMGVSPALVAQVSEGNARFYSLTSEAVNQWRCLDAESRVLSEFNSSISIEKLSAPQNLRSIH